MFLLRLKVIGGSSEDSIVDMETFRAAMIGTLANTNDLSSRKVANGSIMLPIVMGKIMNVLLQ